MKKFLKFLSNPKILHGICRSEGSLTFRENRLCHVEEGPIEKPAGTDQEIDSNPALKAGGEIAFMEDGKVMKSKITGGPDLSGKYKLEDGSSIFGTDGLVNFQSGESLEKKEPAPKNPQVFREKNGKFYTLEGEEMPPEFTPSATDTKSKQEAFDEIDAGAKSAKETLEKQKQDAIKALSEPNKEKATAEITAKYDQKLQEVDTAVAEAKKKIEESLDEDKEIENGTMEALAEEFDVKIGKIKEEGKGEIEETDFKNRLKDPTQLHEWLAKPENRLTMRKLVFPGWDGASTPTKELTTSFSNVQTVLKLDDKEYKVIEKNLRIGNLLEDDMIKKITGVKTKGKEMTAKYFYEGGEKVKGVYTEKSKYIPIWNGTEISFGTEDLEVVKAEDKEFEKKVTSAKAAAPAEGETTAEGGTPAGTPAEGKTAKAGEQTPEASTSHEPTTPGTPEAKKAEEAAKAAATATESRTAAGLDTTPVKPLEPTESKDVAGAKEFNGITYKPNGANFDIINTSTKKVTNTVDEKTLKVLTGQEIPDKEWMKDRIKKAFPYFKVEPEVSMETEGYIHAVFKDNKGNQIMTDYNLTAGEVVPTSTHDEGGDTSELLKDKNPETIVQFNRDLGASVGATAELDDKFANSLSKEEWTEALDLMAIQSSPNESTLAFVIQRIFVDDFKKVDNSKITTIRQKVSAENIVKEWITNKDFVSKETVEKLEIYSGGKLEEGTINEIAKYDFEEDGKEEAIKYLFDAYGKSNPKIAETYLKYADLEVYDTNTREYSDDTNAMKSVLVAINKYTGQDLGEEMIGNIHGSYKQLDSLTAEDLGIESGKAEDLDAAKKALDTKCKDIFTKYLEANAGKKGAENYKEIFETRYGAGFEFKDDPPSANVFARYLEKTGQNILTPGALDGTKGLTPVPGNDKYIKAFLEITTADPGLAFKTEYSHDLIKEIHKVALESKTPMAAIWESECAWYMKSKKVEGVEEKSQDQAVLKLYELAKSPSISAEEKVKILKEINSYREGEEGAYTYVYLSKVLGLTSKTEYATWYNKELTKACFASGKFDELDPKNLEDPNQKEFIEIWKTPLNLVSRMQIGRLAKTIGAENMKNEHPIYMQA